MQPSTRRANTVSSPAHASSLQWLLGQQEPDTTRQSSWSRTG